MSTFWDLQKLTFQLTSAAIKGSAKVATATARASQQSVANSRDRRMVQAGVLGPGDGPAPAGADLFDYRGAADLRSLALPDRGLPVGQLIDVHRGPVGPALLPAQSILRHACIIGPSGSGKTRSLIVPWTVTLLLAGCSVVTVDVKGDFVDEVRQYVAEAGIPRTARAFVWDYSSPRTHRWNFFSELQNDQGLDAATVSLIGRQKENDSQPYFYQRDYRWMKGLIRLVLELDGPAAQPHRLIELLTDQGLFQALVPLSSAAVELGDLAGMPASDYSQYVSGLLNALAVFSDSQVTHATSGSDFTLGSIGEEPTLLVAVARIGDGRRAEQMSSLLLSQFVHSVLGRFDGGQQRPLVFMVDEAPRLKDRVDLEQMLSVARGANAGVCLAAQDVAQFGTAEQQSALLANAHTYISMSGVSPKSAEYLSHRLGTRVREEQSLSQGPTRTLFEGPTRMRQGTVGPVLGAREIMFPPFGGRPAVVHAPSASSAPFLVDLER